MIRLGSFATVTKATRVTGKLTPQTYSPTNRHSKPSTPAAYYCAILCCAFVFVARFASAPRAKEDFIDTTRSRPELSVQLRAHANLCPRISDSNYGARLCPYITLGIPFLDKRDTHLGEGTPPPFRAANLNSSSWSFTVPMDR